MLDSPTPSLVASRSAVPQEVRSALLAGASSLPGIFREGERLMAMAGELGGEPPIQRIAILGAATVDYLSRAVACAVALEGVLPVIYQAPFGSYVQDALNPASPLSDFRPDLAVIAPEAAELVDDLSLDASVEAIAAAIEAKVARFAAIWDALTGRGCRIVQHLLPPPEGSYRGVAERLAPASPVNQIRTLNDTLLQAGRGRVHWVDLERLAGEVGMRNWSGSRFWYTSRLGFNQKCLPDYIPAFRGAWRNASARSKKVLVLDLDNTLWGGVIGDDGLEGLLLGTGSPEGEAFADWQSYLKALGCRGVVLAICSKNARDVAEGGFVHAGAVLARGDFAAFECSWNDKVGGLRRIADTLNVGLDSVVFADDNPAECALVQRELSEVAVVHLGADPSDFIRRLDAGHWFDLADLTPEDLARRNAYAARAQAHAEQAQAADLDGYLAGLAMVGRLYPPKEADIPRMAQLEGKTNQFNLTNRRYSEDAIREFHSRDDAVVLAFRPSDKFGDHGLAATLIAFREGDALRIDSWLMSCRIFSRTAEEFILAGLLRIAEASEVRWLVGEYIRSAKNGVVAGLYRRLGFADEGGRWRLPVEARPTLVTHIADGQAQREDRICAAVN